MHEVVAVKEKILEHIQDHCQDGKCFQTKEHLEMLETLVNVYDGLMGVLEDKGVVARAVVEEETSPVLAKIQAIVHNPPATWAVYKGQPGEHINIIKMEVAEADAAYEKMRTQPPAGTHAQFVDELYHAAAALVYAIEAMSCSK